MLGDPSRSKNFLNGLWLLGTRACSGKAFNRGLYILIESPAKPRILVTIEEAQRSQLLTREDLL